MMRYIIAAVIIAAGLVGCSQLRGAPPGDVQIVAIGDSILDWNRDVEADIPRLVGEQTGLEVFNVAISGAEFFGLFEIPRQYPEGDWDWLIMDGGGNDLSGNCRSVGMAEPVLDHLIDDSDLGGAYADLIDRVTAQGTQVIIMGYAPISSAGGPFASCEFALNDLMDRQARLAASDPDVTFVDVRTVISPDNLAAYDDDLLHPSPQGGALMAGAIAAVINAERAR